MPGTTCAPGSPDSWPTPGSKSTAADLRAQLGKAIWDRYYPQLQLTRQRDAAGSGSSIAHHGIAGIAPPTCRRTSRTGNREVNRLLLVPLARSIGALVKERGAEVPFNSRVEHIASGGVAKYPDIVKISLDELSAEFEGACG